MYSMIHRTTEEAAVDLSISPRTLERWRLEGKGPVFCKFGRRVLYARQDLQRWASKQRREPKSYLAAADTDNSTM